MTFVTKEKKKTIHLSLRDAHIHASMLLGMSGLREETPSPLLSPYYNVFIKP